MTQASVSISNTSTPPTAGKRTLRSQATRYALLSGISFAGNLGLTVLLHEIVGLSAYLAVPIALITMTLFNFFTIRHVVFTDAAGGIVKQFTGFVASIAGFRAAEYVGFVLLHGVFIVDYLPACAAILAASAVCKFLFLRRVVFAIPRSSANHAEARP